jgi:hypothetical protein
MAQARKRGIKSSAQDNFLEPLAPVINSATDVGTGRAYGNGAITVSFTLPANSPAATSYTASAYCSVHNATHTASGASSPLTIQGFGSGVVTTVTVTATNSYGTSVASAASNSVTVTTIPQTPSAPSVSAAGGSATDNVSWSAPNNGGKSITLYSWESNDGKSGTTSSTSVAVGQEAGSQQAYRVKATNGNGTTDWSSYSSTVTSFSFAPFGFTPFGAFGFTPFGAFGFTPFGAFGFTPFGAFGFLNFGFSPSQCVHEDTLIKTPNGLVAAKDIKIGDSIYTLDLNEINSEDPLSLNSASLTSTGLIQSEVQNIEASQKDTLVWFNSDESAKFSQEQPMFVKRDGQYGILSSGLVDVGDILIKVSESGEISETVVTEIGTQEGNFNVYSFATGPKSWYIAGDYLVHIK